MTECSKKIQQPIDKQTKEVLSPKEQKEKDGKERRKNRRDIAETIIPKVIKCIRGMNFFKK